MKRLTERTDIAQAINFKKYPVLHIDLADRDEYGIKGCKCSIDNGKFSDGTPYYVRATCRAYNDERKLTFHSGGTYLSSSFSYFDMEEMLEYANAPVIRPGEPVVVVLTDSEKKVAYAPMVVELDSRVSPHCMNPLRFSETIDLAPLW